MLTMDTHVQTREGLFRLDELDGGPTTVWSGSAWVDVVLERQRERAVWDVAFHEGSTIGVTVDTKLLVVGDEEYTWRPAGRLKVGDLVCRGMSVEAKALNGAWRRKGYWLGQIFAGARTVPRGLSIRIATGSSGSNASIAMDLTKTMAKLRIHATITTGAGGAHDIAFTGKRFEKWSKNHGFIWDHTATGFQAIDIPHGVRMTTNGGRRCFCRALIDALGEALDRKWVLDLRTEMRAVGAQRIFDSVNVGSFRRGKYLHVSQWIASLELGTRTKYPLRSEISGASPLSVQEDFSNGVSRFLQHKRRLHGFLHVVNEIVEGGDNIHPHALRAAWYATGNEPKEPIYDYVVVDSVLPRDSDALVTDIRVSSNHTLAANGYVVHDTMG